MYRPIKNTLLTGLAFLALVAVASGLPTVSVSADTPWLTAGGADIATVTVVVNDGVPGAQVVLSCNSTMGAIMPETLDAAGGTATFTAGTVSGSATIAADYVAPDGTVLATGEAAVNIDHGTPTKISYIDYAEEVTAGSATSLVIRMADRWDNPIDSRRTAETVHFVVGSPGDNAILIYGSNASTDLDVPVDTAGYVRVDLRTDTVPGANVIMVECPGTVSTGYITVTGTATGVPWEMYQTVTPDDDDPYPYQQADGEKVFSIVYSLYDQYGNVAGNRQIHVRIVPQDGYLKAVEKTVTTNEEGKAMISYGPSDVAGIADIVAYAIDNATLTCSQRLEFVSTDPTNMLLSAVPQTVASRDVKSDITSTIQAKVIDIKGNPVANESVSFQIVAVQNGTYVMTEDPAITNGVLTAELDGTPIVACTDRTGFATVDLLPGAFTTDVSNPRYSNLSVGQATVRACWGDQTKDITVSFRNYPYLSVKTWVEPQTVAVNETVNVTIQLIGDGWALHSRPIDVVLCTDRSGSMLRNTTEVSGYDEYDYEWISQESIDDRMVHAMAAAKTFVSQMQSSKDRIGLVSFGQSGSADLDRYGYKYWAGNDYTWEKHFSWWYGSYWQWDGDSSDDATYIASHYHNPQYYGDDATRDLELTRDYRDVNTTIDDWLPCGGTPMREGLYRAVRMILENPRTTGEEPVKAIVLLTDGEWNTGGNPEGGRDAASFSYLGSYDSVIDYAKDNGIKIFTIALGNEPNHDELQSYADQTDGKFYSATAGDDLTLIYDDIALKLQEAAGVNTTMSLIFEDVEVNNVSGYSDVFEYRPINGVSTLVTKYWQTNLTTVSDSYPYSFDQTSDWTDDEVSFDVGDIYLNQAWETTFCLKITEEGNIDIFGPDSIIKFDGTEGQSELPLPKTLVTAVKDLNVTALDQGVVNVTITDATWDGVSFLVPTWELRYSGNKSVVQEVSYQYSSDNLWWDGVWNTFDTIRCDDPSAVNGTYSSSLMVEGINGWYKIRVHAQEDVPGGASGLDTRTQAIHVGNLTQNKIKLL